MLSVTKDRFCPLTRAKTKKYNNDEHFSIEIEKMRMEKPSARKINKSSNTSLTLEYTGVFS